MKPRRQEQQEIRQPVVHEGYPDSHQPKHPDYACKGCDDLRRRLRLNKSAGRAIGVATKDEPVRTCLVCHAPVFAAEVSGRPCWGWNQNPDRAQWAIEPRAANAAPSLCPHCRAANAPVEAPAP